MLGSSGGISEWVDKKVPLNWKRAGAVADLGGQKEESELMEITATPQETGLNYIKGRRGLSKRR